MSFPARLTPFLLTALLGLACSQSGSPAGAPSSTVILVSVDGLGYRSLEHAPTPTFDRMTASGVRAPLVPVFPSKTFPSHYSIVTGLHPDRHGIIANNMYDPVFDASFSLSDRESVEDPRWWGGEPIWVTAQRQGRRTAPLFWPGSEAPIGGMRPTFWRRWDPDVTTGEMVDQALAWLDLPSDQRPAFVTLYLHRVDVLGHNHGPLSPEVDRAIAQVDSAVGRLLKGLEARAEVGTATNVIVVSDHGQAEVSRDRVIFLDDYLDLDQVTVVDWSPVLQIRPAPGQEETVYRALAGKHPHLEVYRKAELPPRLHYGTHRRIPPIVALADEGWVIANREYFASHPDAFTGATHGYDHEVASMQGVFLATGPAFREGVQGEPFQNVHLYAMICRLLGVTPAPNQGSPDSTAVFLR